MASQLSQKRAAETPAIPDRLYFKIGDVAKICGLETYVLRFWESQFPQLKPNKSGTGQRLYRRREVELVLEIKRLVHDEGYTLPGARQALEQQNQRPARTEAKATPAPVSVPTPVPVPAAVQEVPAPAALRLTQPCAESTTRNEAVTAAIGRARAELREIAELLASPTPRPVKRRPRLAAVPHPTDSLFPS